MSNTRTPINNSAATVDVAAILASARLPERTVELCLRGDLQTRWEELERKLLAARRGSKDSLGAGADTAAIEAEMDSVREQMSGSVITVTLRALNRKAFQELTVAHPPTDEDRAKGLTVNWANYREALIRTCAVDPVFDADQWEQLFEVITSGQFTTLAETCDILNHSPVDVPFSPNASVKPPGSEPK